MSNDNVNTPRKPVQAGDYGKDEPVRPAAEPKDTANTDGRKVLALWSQDRA